MLLKILQTKNPYVQAVLDPLRHVRRIYYYLVVPVAAALFQGFFEHAVALFWHRRNFIVRHGFKQDPYQRWILINEPIVTELKLQQKAIDKFPLQPLISIVTPISGPGADAVWKMLDSVGQQNYRLWEHCLVSAPDYGDANSLCARAQQEPRIHLQTLEQGGGIIRCTRAALNMAQGDWVAFLDQHDQLAPFALMELVRTINQHPDADVIYSDQDHIDPTGKHRFAPFFKPELNLDYLRSMNYLPRLLVVRKLLLDSIDWPDSAIEGAQDFDLVLRLVEKTSKIYHISKILYHQRVKDAGSSDLPLISEDTASAGEKVLAAHLNRSGCFAAVRKGVYPYQVCYGIAGQPKVSMIIPTRDNIHVLKRLLDSIFEKTTYPHYEIILVENGSQEPQTFAYYREIENDPRVKIVAWKQPFNYSDVNNFGAQYAAGEVILLLNNDLEVINDDWLERMLEHAQRQEIGVVGAKLLYPNNTIQHGGVIVGMFRAAGHSHKFYPHDSPGYFNRLISVQNYSASTAACLMVRKSVFQEVGGLDPIFQVEFGDVDFCLRILAKGYQNLWTPYALLYHHESQTRGNVYTKEKWKLNRKEVRLFKTRWQDFLQKGDPSYSPHLTIYKEDFGLFVR